MRLNFFIAAILFLIVFSCKSEDENPVEASTVGKIEGHITSVENGTSITKVNVFTTPPTSLVTTNTEGYYLIDNIVPGEYSITGAKEGLDTLTASISVSAGATTKADFLLQRYDSSNVQIYSVITGSVTDSKSYLRLTNVSIKTLPPTSSVTTNSAGYFTLENVTPGEYKVIAQKAGYDSTQISITAVKGKTVFADIQIIPSDTTVVSEITKISGYAIDATTGEKLSDVQVKVDPPVSSVVTDQTGFYEIDNVEPGQYTVTAAKIGYTNFTVDVTAIKGFTTNADLLLVKSTGIVFGTVRNAADSAPISGVYINTTPGNGTQITDDNGNFRFENLPPGSIAFTAEKQGFLSEVITVHVQANKTIEADILMNAN